jgi:hypothetical protein
VAGHSWIYHSQGRQERRWVGARLQICRQRFTTILTCTSTPFDRTILIGDIIYRGWTSHYYSKACTGERFAAAGITGWTTSPSKAPNKTVQITSKQIVSFAIPSAVSSMSDLCAVSPLQSCDISTSESRLTPVSQAMPAQSVPLTTFTGLQSMLRQLS